MFSTCCRIYLPISGGRGDHGMQGRALCDKKRMRLRWATVTVLSLSGMVRMGGPGGVEMDEGFDVEDRGIVDCVKAPDG